MPFILGLISKLGLGWIVKWLTGGVFSSFAGLIVAGATELFSVLGIVLRWIVKTFIEGINHIIKSVPAVIVVIALSWGSYGYAKYVKPVEARHAVEAPRPSPPAERRPSPPRGGGFLEEIFGPWILF